MRALWIVLRKELLDAFRDRRMVLVAFLVMPLAVPSILGGTAALGARKHAEQLEGTLRLPVVGAEYAPNLVAWLAQQNIEIVAPPTDADEDVRAQRHDVVLRIDDGFAEDWRGGRPARVEVIFDGSRPIATGATVARVRGLLDGYSETVGTLRLVARGIHPAVAHPLQVGTRNVAAPEARFDLTQQLLPYLLLLLAFIGGMQVAIDATAGERERQSLEPLLATPASREAIISAKILATAVFALLTVTMTLLAYRVSLAVMPGDLLEASFAIGPIALLELFLVILPIVLLGATVLTGLAAFARSYREAQGYLPLLLFLPMVPTLVLMVAPVRTRPWMLAVPFLGQNQLILQVLRSEHIAPTEWFISLGAGVALVVVAWLVAARLYHQEHLAASS
ncbi:MAG TPA: ABC transporter permease [Steroidobacteraceae bacterium]|nr:ABC transporter permease [Steroidobacteraceae bacterium]